MAGETLYTIVLGKEQRENLSVLFVLKNIFFSGILARGTFTAGDVLRKTPLARQICKTKGKIPIYGIQTRGDAKKRKKVDKKAKKIQKTIAFL